MRPDSDDAVPTTGHKTFDRETSGILTGNVLGDTQYGSFVRGFNDVEANGMAFEPGQLQQSDLKGFRDVLGLPSNVDRQVREALKERSGILYCFFSGKPRTMHGWLLSATGRDFYETLGTWTTGPTSRSAGIVSAMESWLTYPRGTAAKGERAAREAAAALADSDNEALREIMAVAGEAEEAKPGFGAWRVLKDVADREWHALPRGLEHLAPRIDALEEGDARTFVAARILVEETVRDMHRATFPAGERVETTACMQLTRMALEEYADLSPAAPRP